MKKNYIKRLLSIFLIIVMLSPVSYGLENANKLKKEEIIYSKINFEGKSDLLIGVSGFPKGFKGYDYGDFSEVVNLSTPDELIYDQGRVNIDAKENFYYQGKLVKKKLPWLISMKWTLDDNLVTEEELLGKDGHLKLVYQIRLNPAVSSKYFDYFVVQSSFQFNVDQISNLKAPDGTLAAAGSMKMVNFMSLPGKGGRYTLEADVQNYEPGMVQIAALPLNIALDLSEISEYTEDLKTLEMAIAELNGGTWEFLDGLYQVKEGSAAYKEGGSQLLGGSGQLGLGLSEVSQASKEFAGGVKQLGGGLNQLIVAGKGEEGHVDDPTKDPETLIDASARFLTAFQLLGLSDMIEIDEEQAQAILDGFDLVIDSLITLLEIDEESLENIVLELDKDIISLETSIENLKIVRDKLLNPPYSSLSGFENPDVALEEHVSNHFKGLMSDRAGELTSEITELEQIKMNLSLQKLRLEAFKNKYSALKDSFVVFKGLLDDIKELLDDLDITVDTLLDLSKQLKELSEGYEKFHKGLIEYVDGVEQVYFGVAGEGNTTLLYGAKALSSGLDQLDYGFRALDSGLGDYVHGFWPLNQGLADLYSGGLELGRGTEMMAEETKDIDKKMEEQISQQIGGLSGDSESFESFLSPKNKNISSVQFVLLYEGKTLPKEKEDDITIKEKTFLDRFIDLFKSL